MQLSGWPLLSTHSHAFHELARVVCLLRKMSVHTIVEL